MFDSRGVPWYCEARGRLSVRNVRRFRGCTTPALVLGALALLPRPAAADAEARGRTMQRYLLAEPTSYMDVLDGFEGSRLPQVRVALGYHRTQSAATIGRERVSEGERTAGGYRSVARSEQVIDALSLDLAVGVYRDLMVLLRVPLVLSDKRSLKQPSDAPDASSSEPQDASASGEGDPSQALFNHNARSATRSGVPAVDIGAAWGITNQYRTSYLPTWVVTVESRLGLGEVLRPCQPGYPCSAGVSRGTIALTLDSRWSYRFPWIEPYLGMRYVHEWASAAASRFSPDGVPDALDTGLPSTQELTLGAALMLWEDRARFQRLSIDLRGQAAYVSAGRDYTPLFDVLGLSSNPQLSAANESANLLPFYGITQTAQHARFRAQLAVGAQAARYIQFRLGASIIHVTRHLLSGAAACLQSGVTQAQCAPDQQNPLYRAVLDMPGQRFAMLGNFSYELFAAATGQF